MKWTSVLFLLGYCQKATQNGFRLYVQFEQINKGMFVQATFLYPENFTHSAKTTKKYIYIYFRFYIVIIFLKSSQINLNYVSKIRLYNRSN